MINEIHYGNRFLRLYQYCSFFFALLLFTSCKDKPAPYSILEFSGEGTVANYSKSVFLVSHKSDSISQTALLSGSGDLIVINDEIFLYRESSEIAFSFKSINEEEYVNGKINSINIPRNDEMIPWFEQIKNKDISSLNFLNFDSAINKNYLPYLADLAKNKPATGLGYVGGDMKDISGLFKMFNPRFIVAGTISQKDFDMLPGLTNLELLMVTLNDSINTIPLPALPGLKQLILGNLGADVILSDNLLINNKQIERLVIMNSGGFDFSLIEPLANLKELVISGPDTLENFDLINNHKQLEVLSISGEELKYDHAMKELPGIRWMSFYTESTQDEFKSFIQNHPDLEVVEIFSNKIINSLEPLLKLRNLYGLAITDTLTDIGTIKSLTNLKYLSLPEAVLKDSLSRTELHKSLPGTRIVANEGFCLGSGWLLLIIPLIFLFAFMAQRWPSSLKSTY